MSLPFLCPISLEVDIVPKELLLTQPYLILQEPLISETNLNSVLLLIDDQKLTPPIFGVVTAKSYTSTFPIVPMKGDPGSPCVGNPPIIKPFPNVVLKEGIDRSHQT